MSFISMPSNESARLAALRELGVLDTPPDDAFDGLVKAASLICGMPIALISLVDEHRQWFKANIGLPGVTETPREQAFCNYTIMSDDLLEVPDAALDARFDANPLVLQEPKIRYYAGWPLLLSNGHHVGSLCVIDRHPRLLTAQQREILGWLARAAASMLEQFQAEGRHRAIASRLQKSERFLEQTGQLAGVGGWAVELATNAVTWSSETRRIHGVAADYQPDLESAIKFFSPEARPKVRAVMEKCRANGGPWDEELPFVRADGARRWVRTMGDVVTQGGQQIRLTGAIQDVTDRVQERMDLHLTRERMALATDSGGIGVWDWDVASTGQVWSARMFALHGMMHTNKTVRYTDWAACVHPDDITKVEIDLRDALAGIVSFDSEYRVIWPDGSIHHLRSAGSVTRDAAGKPVRFIGVDWDVTESRRMANELAAQHEMLRTTLQSIGDGVITADRHGLTTWLNPVAERLTGWQTAEAIGRPVADVYAVTEEETGALITCPVVVCLAGGDHSGAARGQVARMPNMSKVLRSRTKDQFGVEDLASPIRDKSGEILGVVLVFHDVTEQRRVSSEMSYRATHDALTGLLNRSEFEMRLKFLLHKTHADNNQSALLFIDLDQFKLVNDACGHKAGDHLLLQVGKLMSEAVRSSDTVARLGGDEFAIILDGCKLDQAQDVAQNICDLMENYRFDHEGQRFRVGASIGLVPVDQRWPAISGILQAADDCCYAAKEAGRNRVHVWSDTDVAMRDRHNEMQWAARLTRALDEDHFELFAQRLRPLRTAGTGIHAEVLLRLRAPDGTLSSPGIFIPAAERFHLASRIDRWVLRRAIDWMNKAALDKIEMLCINLSGQSVGDRAFHRWAVDVLAAAGPHLRHRLCIEITETAAVTNLADASKFIQQIRELGVRVALDDFGAGASSFGYLKTMLVDFLKIDGQFVRNLVTDTLDQAAVRCFVDVASLLGIQTIAEYVDHPDVLAKLQMMGVDLAQGFLIDRPKPIADLLETKTVDFSAGPAFEGLAVRS